MDIIKSYLNYCSTISTIPQFGGTCWFNAILMVVLYSQNSRKILFDVIDGWDSKNKFLMICKKILLNHYFSSYEASVFFNKFKPEVILFYMLKYHSDNEVKKNFKKLIKDYGYNNLAFYGFYIHNVYKNLGVKCLDISYLKKDDKFLINFYKNLHFDSTENTLQLTTDKLDFIIEDNEIKRIKDDMPDIIIFNHSDLSSSFSIMVEKCFNEIKEDDIYIRDVYDADYQDVMIEGLKECNNTIMINNNKYHLEACLLDSYNTINPINNSFHLVAGLTCNDKRFIYNGWSKTKTEEENVYYGDDIEIACPLKKLNWNLHNKRQFCFKPKNCEVKNAKNGAYCFSFANIKNGTLIYIRDDIIKRKKNNKELYNSSLSLKSDFELIVKDIHDIKLLSNEELIKQLNQFKVVFPEGEEIPNKKELQKLLYAKLTEFFNHPINRTSTINDNKRNRSTSSNSSLKKKKKLKNYSL
jgi:hypothetical protein